ncbi:DCC1-like thiol-disulfide oxidoreductase family protein [Deltaproteobacteria bacterium]|nr:DCC1-like thiol-disulfide oxidoreductase family protein [Deltaproteobacteria bacterium]
MAILLFDGHCNFCNAWVRLIVRRDTACKILFAPLQSSVGRKMLEEHKIDDNYTDSLVFFEEEKFSVSSTAALRIYSYLDGWERHLQLLSVVPRPFRDALYHFIAKYRYKWFGRREQCMIPSQELRERFLSD